jgi:hypothetical protein
MSIKRQITFSEPENFNDKSWIVRSGVHDRFQLIKISNKCFRVLFLNYTKYFKADGDYVYNIVLFNVTK